MLFMFIVCVLVLLSCVRCPCLFVSLVASRDCFFPTTLFLQTCMRLCCSSVVGGVTCRHVESCSSSTLSLLCYVVVFELGLPMLLGVVAIVFDVSLSFA